MLPYFSYGVIYSPLKILFSAFARKRTSWSEIWKLLVGVNPNGALWFLYSLFFMMAAPLLLINRKNYKYWVTFAFVCSFIGTTQITGITIIYKSLQNYVWFILGCGFGNSYKKIKGYSARISLGAYCGDSNITTHCFHSMLCL